MGNQAETDWPIRKVRVLPRGINKNPCRWNLRRKGALVSEAFVRPRFGAFRGKVRIAPWLLKEAGALLCLPLRSLDELGGSEPPRGPVPADVERKDFGKDWRKALT